jgi:hypothetical protein
MVSLRMTDKNIGKEGFLRDLPCWEMLERKSPVVKILVAEDESVTRGGIVALLKKMGL